MPTPPKPSIREVLISEIKAQEPKSSMDANLQQSSILDAAARKLQATTNKPFLLSGASYSAPDWLHGDLIFPIPVHLFFI
jgi:hypothetical protein